MGRQDVKHPVAQEEPEGVLDAGTVPSLERRGKITVETKTLGERRCLTRRRYGSSCQVVVELLCGRVTRRERRRATRQDDVTVLDEEDSLRGNNGIATSRFDLRPDPREALGERLRERLPRILFERPLPRGDRRKRGFLFAQEHSLERDEAEEKGGGTRHEDENRQERPPAHRYSTTASRSKPISP